MRAKTFSRKFMLPISAGTMRLDADINSKCVGSDLQFPPTIWSLSSHSQVKCDLDFVSKVGAVWA